MARVRFWPGSCIMHAAYQAMGFVTVRVAFIQPYACRGFTTNSSWPNVGGEPAEWGRIPGWRASDAVAARSWCAVGDRRACDTSAAPCCAWLSWRRHGIGRWRGAPAEYRGLRHAVLLLPLGHDSCETTEPARGARRAARSPALPRSRAHCRSRPLSP